MALTDEELLQVDEHLKANGNDYKSNAFVAPTTAAEWAKLLYPIIDNRDEANPIFCNADLKTILDYYGVDIETLKVEMAAIQSDVTAKQQNVSTLVSGFDTKVASAESAIETQETSSVAAVKAEASKASTYATNAKTSETNAATYANNAKTYAESIDLTNYALSADVEESFTTVQTMINALSNYITNQIGRIFFFPATEPPDHTMVCNGAAISRTVYSNLFAVIGTTFGSGDGSTTFNLPDLRGLFIRGTGGNAGTLGVTQSEGLPEVAGTLTLARASYRIDEATGAFVGTTLSGSSMTHGEEGAGDVAIDFKASSSNSIYGSSDHVTPENMALLPCIIYE